MNNFKKIACLVALSVNSHAANVALNSSFAVVDTAVAELDANSTNVSGAMLGVAYVQPTTEFASVYGEANLFLSPALVSNGGPRLGQIGVGGVFANPELPVKAKIGLVAQAAASSDADSSTDLSVGMRAASMYEVAPGYELEFGVSTTVHSSGAFGSSSSAVTLGVTKTLEIEA